MTALNRKLLRDLLLMKGQVVAICLVIACGVATFVMSTSTLESLQRTQEHFYEHHRFAQVFAHLKRAPNSLRERVVDIPGVAQVQTRVVERVILDVAGFREPAVGRLVSLPENPALELNKLYLRRGRFLDPARSGEALVSEAFAEAHGLKPGDSVRAVINGRRQRLSIVGIVLSPEYIYQIRPGDILPDNKRFGVFWVGYSELAAAFNMQGAFNDVALTVLPGASEAEVIARLDRLTELYGGLGAYGRGDQASHKFVSNEIKELRGMALVVPGIFLAVAVFLLNVVVARLVSTQREQIATLKAFGYTWWEIGWHYLKLVMAIVVVGVILGTAAGAWLGQGVTALYTRFFRFPTLEYHLSSIWVLLGFFLSLAAAVSGPLLSVNRGCSLPPAEAMRPEPPAQYRPTFIERLGLQRLFSASAKLVLRNLERRPLKALLSCFGISLAVAILVLGLFMLDALDYVMDSQFQIAQRQDLNITFIEPTVSRALFDLQHLPGVLNTEPFRTLDVRLRVGHHSRRLGIMGLKCNGRLYRLMDIKRRAVHLPPEGIILSEKLGEVLGVRPGEQVTVEVLEGERPIREIVVSGLVTDFEGMAAYMDIEAVHRLMREGDVISGAFVAADSRRLDSLYQVLKETPLIAGVTLKRATLDSFRQTLAENLLRMRAFNVLFAAIIACGVVYNSGRISLSEQSRELATLRVIGFTRGEISVILLGELALLTLAAIPVGLVLGHGLASLVIHVAYDTELFRIPLIIDPPTYAFAALVTLAAAIATGWIIRRRLQDLDLVAVLKCKE